MADIDGALGPHESGHTYDLKGNVTSDTTAELKAERITVARDMHRGLLAGGSHETPMRAI